MALFDFRKFPTASDDDVWRKFAYAVIGESYSAISFGNALWANDVARRVRIAAGGNANDTAEGTGAKSATLVGIGEDLSETTSLLTSAGTDASEYSEGKYYRVYRIRTKTDTYLKTVGGGNNVGAMTFEDEESETVAVIPALGGGSEIGHFMVPAGLCLHLDDLSFTVQADPNQSRDIEIRIMTRANSLVDGVLVAEGGAPEGRYYKIEDTTGRLSESFGGQRFLEGEEFWIEAKVESNTAVVTVSMTGRLTTMANRDKVTLRELRG